MRKFVCSLKVGFFTNKDLPNLVLDEYKINVKKPTFRLHTNLGTFLACLVMGIGIFGALRFNQYTINVNK